MKEKNIAYIILILLVLSIFTLSFIEKKQSNINNKKIWMIYFDDPKNESTDFFIENHSENTTFNYKIIGDNNVLEEKEIIINNGLSEKIITSIKKSNYKKIKISVSNKNEMREIYKIF